MDTPKPSLRAHKRSMLDYASNLRAVADAVQQEYDVSDAELAKREATREHKVKMAAYKLYVRQISGDYVPHV